jgi:hypothetical protein
VVSFADRVYDDTGALPMDTGDCHERVQEELQRRDSKRTQHTLSGKGKSGQDTHLVQGREGGGSSLGHIVAEGRGERAIVTVYLHCGV